MQTSALILLSLTSLGDYNSTAGCQVNDPNYPVSYRQGQVCQRMDFNAMIPEGTVTGTAELKVIRQTGAEILQEVEFDFGQTLEGRSLWTETCAVKTCGHSFKSTWKRSELKPAQSGRFYFRLQANWSGAYGQIIRAIYAGARQ